MNGINVCVAWNHYHVSMGINNGTQPGHSRAHIEMFGQCEALLNKYFPYKTEYCSAAAVYFFQGV